VARVVEGFHDFTCTPTRLSANGMHAPYPPLPSRLEARPHLQTPEGWKAELAKAPARRAKSRPKTAT